MPNKPFFAPPAKGQSQLTGPLDIPIVHTLYQIYASWSALLNKFPKTERYTLGQTIAGELLTCLELIITAASTPSAPIKIENLRQASAKLDLLRLLIRLAKDCKCISNQAYLAHESQLHEAGRMLGGWLKSLS